MRLASPWSELQKLPYLVRSLSYSIDGYCSDRALQSAVIREGLRLSYGVTTRLPRIAHEDIRYKNYVIPAGVSIASFPVGK